MAVGAIAVPVVLLIAAIAMGGGGKKDKIKAAYDAGYARGKADALNSRAEQLNPAADALAGGLTAEQADAYAKGYTQGYTDNKKTGPVTPADPKKKPPQYNGKDTETLTQAYNRGLAQGQADGLQDGSAGNAYGAHHTLSSYTRADLRNSYEKGFEAAYGAAYAAGKKKAEEDDGIIMGDVLGTQGGSARDFRPHTNLARRGLPRYWYNM